ncbi:MAG: hypothetical protein GWP08_01285 [Nitrospiraceae bacterium]|nr:hypothetical protein [Nitrospiraceae bacterium]
MKPRHAITYNLVSLIPCLLVLLAVAASAGAENLWEIGKADDDTREFALAPDRHGQFTEDARFVVGVSDPGADWPYAHPGPADAWAGARRHTFVVVFGIDGDVPEGFCRLRGDLVDTHSDGPPELEIALNGHVVKQRTKPGTGDASIFGNPAAGTEHHFYARFPSSALKQGANVLSITTVSGSWMLYDWLGFSAPDGTQLTVADVTTMLQGVTSPPALAERDGRMVQMVQVGLRHFAEPAQATVKVGGMPPVTVELARGAQQVEVPVPAVDEAVTIPVEVSVGGETIGNQEVRLEPVRRWEVCLLHHTHLDIGYTHLQTEVEEKQWEFLDQAIELARKTAGYPEDSRFKWLPEGLWAVDSYLARASEEKRATFIDAVKKGWIGLNALYGNELTALCRPEELLELTGYARRLSRQSGLPIDTAMITDVPGYTWGLVPALAQSGVKYLSMGPNSGHRIGYTLTDWGDRPFYWASPSGEEKVLCWMAGKGYSWFHSGPLRDEEGIFGYLNDLDEAGYPYDMVQVRYSIGGDNGPPDPQLPDFVRDWNAKYVYPKLRIMTTSEMFHEFEERYADVIPTERGDFTPYWEDGAASSARETALNREAAERLVQAQALWALLAPAEYPAERFQAAWRDVILYDEHTWGAHNSISQPESEFAKGQWTIKQAFALEADRKSRALLAAAQQAHASDSNQPTAVHVFNTSSWRRTDLVTVPAAWDLPGDQVRDAQGKTVASQRLSTGELAFVARGVPALGAAQYTFHPGGATATGAAKANANSLLSGRLSVTISEETGDIASLKLRAKGSVTDLTAPDGVSGLNGYFYVEGREPTEPKRNGKPTIRMKEQGPIVASLLIESDAPGCHKLTREVRVIEGIERVDLINVVDKENIYDQEGVHFAFPFRVPGGVIRMDTPWAVVQAEADQLKGACKNYFTVQRWVDVSGGDMGVTWATVDAPLIEIGAITTDARAVGWLREVPPSTTFYSYVMNNYWETNYKAGQEGPTTFRYSIRPHGTFDAAAATRFGMEQSQPLIAVPAKADTPVPAPLLRVLSRDVVVSVLKPSDDGQALVLRLFGASGRPASVGLEWAADVYKSGLNEKEAARLSGEVKVPPYGIVTLRAPRT